MKFLTNVLTKITEALQNGQKAQVLFHFRDMTDRQLDDMGISRELLNVGIKAYPWRAEQVEETFTYKAKPVEAKTADVIEFTQPAKQEEQPIRAAA